MRLYGCFSRAPLRSGDPVQDGWFIDGVTKVPKLVGLPFRMKRDCQYTLDPLVGSQDQRCTGCRWKSEINSTKEPQQ